MADLRPAKLIKGNMSIITSVGSITDPTSAWIGESNAWRVAITVTPQITSYPGNRNDFKFDARDIVVGDWVASSSGAIAVKITEIVSQPDNNSVVAIVEDEDLYNVYADGGSTGVGIGPSGRCVVFELAENGLPVLTPVPTNYLPNTFQGDLLSRFFYMKKLAAGGGSDYLQEPEDGTFTDGTFPDWEVGVTTVSTAIDDLSGMLSLLIPPSAPKLSTKALSVTGAASARGGSDIYLANSVVNNDLTLTAPPAAGTKVLRVSASPVSTDMVTSFHDGKAGTLTAKINGAEVGSKVLTDADDTGTVGGLVINKDVAYPADKPGFWTALDARVTGAVLTGINRIELSHSATGNATPVVFAHDPFTTAPVASNFTVDVSSSGVMLYSSGVPHYQAGAKLKVGAEVNNLAGQTYLAKGVVQFSTSPDIGSLNLDPGTPGIPTILDINQAPVTVGDQLVTLAGNTHTTSIIRVRGANAHTDGAYLNGTVSINYMNGTGAGIVEAGKAMSGITLKRIAMSGGGRPDDEVLTFAGATFDSGSSSALGDATATHEAIIRGGVLRCDQTNYSTGYLPPGPNYSGRPATQYATFILKKISNSMSVTFTGVDPSEIWIKLPGLARSMPTSINGWWDAKKAADFAPGRWPGDAGASDGCQSSKSGTTYNITFGSASSSGSSDNIVMIRVALTAGQALSNIAVTI